MRRAACLLLLGLLVLGANAQGDTPTEGPDSKSGKLSVTGSASVTVEPDMGKIYELVTVTRPSVSAACGVAANATDAVIAAAEESGDGVKVTTENISVRPNITYGENGKEERSGYICEQTLLITVEQAGGSGLDADMSAALDATIKAGGNYLQVSSMATDLSDDLRSEATNQARELAVANALDTATILAKAAKVQLGAVVSIVDSNVAPPSPIPIAQPAAGAAMDAAASTPIQTGTTDVAATVAIDYAITPEAQALGTLTTSAVPAQQGARGLHNKERGGADQSVPPKQPASSACPSAAAIQGAARYLPLLIFTQPF